jgi:nucleotidyltransferase substrate binding protein (TIGR01987 family)
MVLDLSSLRKAVESLERAIQVAHVAIPGMVDTDQQEVIRAGVIQNFEFTYEISWKFLKRWLESVGGESSVDALTRKELFRLASEKGLIQNLEAWFDYHYKRNKTSHTYDPLAAEEVYQAAIRFVVDSRALLKTLETRND